jgi:predicted permease
MPATIVGVTPPGFVGAGVGSIVDVTTALAMGPELNRGLADLMGPGVFWLRVLARPVPGLSPAEAASRLNKRWPALADVLISPKWPAVRRRAMADSLFVFERGATGWSPLRESYGKPLAVLMAVAGVVLLIACANVASLFLARATTRMREMSVRLAIGASRGRIVRQLLMEGTLLSSAGAALGIFVAWASGRFLVDLMSTGSNRLEFDLTPNAHLLMFSAALAVATGIVFGLAPAFQIRQAQPVRAFKGDERTATRRSRLLPSLVTGQVALSLVLLAGAGLFVRSLINLQRLNPGFSATGVFVVGLDRDQSPAPTQVAEIVRAVPGVIAAAPTTHTPLDGASWSEAIVPAGQRVPDTDNTLVVGVGAGFLEALEIPLSAGRAFSDRDMNGGPDVAVINERYAARVFAKRNPLGQRIVGTLLGQSAEMEIVGIVKDTKVESLREQSRPIVYVPYPRFGARLPPSLAIRGEGSPVVLAESIRGTLQSQLPSWPFNVHTLSSQLSRTLVQEGMLATLAAGFGALALVLSAVGLYGLLAYGVAQRSKEIGIRMALGAHAARIVSSVIANAFRLVGVGLAIGLPVAWAASRSLQSMLFDLKPTDPAVMTAAIALLVTAALVAAYFPARRASRVDPLTALRHE